MKKWFIILGVILAVTAVFVYLYAWSDPDDMGATAPETITLPTGSLLVTVEATGRVVPAQQVEIKCKASGEIIKLPKDISDPVKQNDLLVQLDPVNEKRSVQQAEATLAISQAEVKKAELSLEVAKHNLTTARSRAQAAMRSAQASSKEALAKIARARELHEKNIISKDELEVVETTHAQSEAELANAKAAIADLLADELQLQSLRQDLQIAKARLESDRLALSDAQQRLEDTTVLSPIDGVVAVREVQVGQIIASGINNVGGGTSVLTLVDLQRMFVLVSVDESDIGRIQLGQAAQIQVDAYPERVFSGEVVRVATQGVSTSNVVTFEVKVEVHGDALALLKPEMTANVEIIVVDKQDVLLAPISAISRNDGQPVLIAVSNDGSTHPLPVTLGAGDGDSIEILSGASPGTEIEIPGGTSSSRWRQGDSEAARKARRARRMRSRMMRGRR